MFKFDSLKTLFFLLIVFIGVSCDDGEIIEPEPEPEEQGDYYLTSIRNGNGAVYSFLYNENNKIKTINEHSENQNNLILRRQKIFYKDDGETIERIEQHWGYTNPIIARVQFFEYPHPDTIIVRDSSTTSLPHSKAFVHVFDNSSNCNLKSVTVYDHPDKLREHYEFTYTDDNCSYEYTMTGPSTSTRIVKIKHNDQNSAKGSIEIPNILNFSIVQRYDDMNIFNKYNIIECETTDEDGVIHESLTYNVTYEYNEDGYPTRASRIYGTGGGGGILFYVYDRW